MDEILIKKNKMLHITLYMQKGLGPSVS